MLHNQDIAFAEPVLVFAALMQGEGSVLAFDKDPRRLQRLKANAAATGAHCIRARVADFLQLPLATSPEFRRDLLPSQLPIALVWRVSASMHWKYYCTTGAPIHLVGLRVPCAVPCEGECIDERKCALILMRPIMHCRNVKGALVDPSCSGSGTTLSRMDFLLPSHAAQLSLGPASGRTAESKSAASGMQQSRAAEESNDTPGCAEQQANLGSVNLAEHEGHIPHEEREEVGSAEAPGDEKAHRAERAGEHDGEHSAGRGDSGKRSEVDRVERLARFQEAVVRHALTLPALQRLVYSTCSVHERENEAVVAAVLPYMRELGFELVDPFPRWHRRGLAGSVEGAEKLVRTHAVEDGTDGFFLAVFQRGPESSEP